MFLLVGYILSFVGWHYETTHSWRLHLEAESETSQKPVGLHIDETTPVHTQDTETVFYVRNRIYFDFPWICVTVTQCLGEYHMEFSCAKVSLFSKILGTCAHSSHGHIERILLPGP